MNKILIADDSRLIISLVKNIFEKQPEGYTIVSAADGREACDKARSENPDVILMDWQMPIMSGVEALAELKEDTSMRDIPVIMLTASDSVAAAFENGAADFVQKPFDKPELLARVKAVLDLVNTQKELKRKNIEIDIQRDKLKMQKEMLVKLKRDLSESYSLATNISNNLFPTNESLHKVLNNSFLLSMPKEEDSNHFFWLRKKENTAYFAAAYCNKKGLTASLLELFSYQILDQILKSSDKSALLQPAQILNTFQTHIDKVCSTNDCENHIDIALCAFDSDKKTLQYAGVNVPVYVVKNKKLVELKTDIHDPKKAENKTFTNHKVQLAENDMIYLLNDGFNEYNSGNNYLSEEISDLIMKIFAKDAEKQQQLMNKTFTNWKSELKQIEDILVLGFRV